MMTNDWVGPSHAEQVGLGIEPDFTPNNIMQMEGEIAR